MCLDSDSEIGVEGTYSWAPGLHWKWWWQGRLSHYRSAIFAESGSDTQLWFSVSYIVISPSYQCFNRSELSVCSDDSHSVVSAKELKTSKALSEIIYVESKISKLRSTAVDYSNYIPFLRIFEPFQRRNAHGVDIGRRRREYNAVLLDELKERVKAGTDEPCIQGNVLKDPTAKLSPDEMISISLSMMAVGLWITPSS